MSTRPNFVFIVADDLGYTDLGCTGSREPVSPNLDRLASQGLLFSSGCASSSLCSPTRFTLITSRSQYLLRDAAEQPLAGCARKQHAGPAAEAPDAAFAAGWPKLR
jgi:arylsulfatase A-like enzyme